jgi:hypothetical protein
VGYWECGLIVGGAEDWLRANSKYFVQIMQADTYIWLSSVCTRRSIARVTIIFSVGLCSKQELDLGFQASRPVQRHLASSSSFHTRQRGHQCRVLSHDSSMTRSK